MAAASESDIGRLVSIVGSRRGAVAALLAGAVGVGAAQAGQDASAKQRKRKHKHKDKRKNINNRNRNRNTNTSRITAGGDAGETPPLPNLAIVEASTAITGAGVISATTACPPGFVAIGGGFDVNGADPTGLVGEGPIELANGWAWQVSVNLTSAGTDASIDTFAICLEAHIVVET